MKYWLVATYKINEIKRVQSNLLNQGFEYYLPKITTKKLDSIPKEEVLFPGYIFINTSFNKYLSVKYTKGIKDILKFGDKISCITDNDIKSINSVEESSRLHPLTSKMKIGQEATIKNGSFKGNIVKICSMPSRRRVDILINLLGSIRRVNVLEEDLIF